MSARTVVTVEEFRSLCQRYSAWGRWGASDQFGAMNYIDEGCRRGAAELVRRGRVISCALPFDQDGPQCGVDGRDNPVRSWLTGPDDIAAGAQDHVRETRFIDDAVYMPLQCGTQWDGLAHIFHHGKMYNGFSLSDVTAQGAQKNGIHLLADRVVGRGVLLDIARHRGVPWLEPGDVIDDKELAACAHRQGIDVRRGDIVLVRTGQIAQHRNRGSWHRYTGGRAPGLGLRSVHYLCGRQVAAVATDTYGVEVRPNETPDVDQPLHLVLLVYAGVSLGEIFDLDRLADDCAEDGIYEFMFVGAPLPFTGAVGSPVNPLAIK